MLLREMLVLVFSCIFPDIVTVGFTTAFIVLIYYFAWDYYAEKFSIADGVVNLLFKVRNLKPNDFYWSDRNTYFNNAEMQNPTTTNSFLFSPKSSLFASNNREGDISGNVEPITSTPMTYWMKKEKKLFTPPKQSPSLNQSRYSLSDTQTTYESPKNLNQTLNGPLLASTSFHNNVSTYLDSKSPGLTQRLLQYSKEYKPSHQPKYGRPGILPIVHLNKKDKSERCIQPKQVKVRLSKPDYPIFTTPEHHKLLLDGLIQDPVRPEVSDNDSGTRSVLDALKEISRKRILANESSDEQETSKKQKMETLGNFKNQKRCREETSPQNVSTGDGPTKKKPCFVDAVTASYLSINLANALKQPQKRKVQETEEEPMQPKEKKALKSSDAETQTKIVATKEVAIANDRDEIQDTPMKVDAFTQSDIEEKLANGEEQIKDKQEEIVHTKIFDDAPLEISRMNKLRSLLGAMTGQKPELLPYENKLQKFIEQSEKSDDSSTTEDKKTEEKQPVSIISPQNKPKHDKHVTFDLPNEMQEQPTKVTTLLDNQNETTISVSNAPSVCQLPETPKSSLSLGFGEPKLSSRLPSFNPIPLYAPGMSSPVTTTASPIASTSSLVVSTTSTVAPMFSVTPTISSVALTTSPVALTFSIPTTSLGASKTSSVPVQSSPTFNFTSKPIPVPVATEAISPPKVGGFKFDLKNVSPPTKEPTTAKQKDPSFTFSKPTTNVSSSNVISVAPSFSNVTTSATFGMNVSTGSEIPVSVTKSSNTPFLFKPVEKKTDALPTFPTISSVSTSSGFSLPIATTTTQTTTSFSFTPKTAEQPKLQTGFSFGAISSNATVTSSVAPSVTSLPTFASVPNLVSNSAQTAPTTSTALTFTASQSSIFGKPTEPTTTTPTTNFMFGAPNKPIFGQTTTTTGTSMFGNNNFMSTNGFGEAPTTTPTTTTSEKTLFGSTTPKATLAATTNPSGFAFNTNTTSAPSGFGASSGVQGFGGFGSNTTASNFGASATTTQSFPTTTAFGSSFGSTTTAMNFNSGSNGFGSSNAAITSVGGFGVATTTTSIGFGTSSTPSVITFGSNMNSGSFGVAKSTASGFNFKSNTSTAFGSSSTASLSFGTNTSASVPSFGAPVKSTPIFSFGASNAENKPDFPAPNFGATTTGFGTQPFGSTDTTTNFGQKLENPNPFGTSTTFGSSSTFGGTATNNAFGGDFKPSTTSESAFGKPLGFATPAPSFNSTSNSFGTPNTNEGPSTSTFAFGQSASQPQSKVFAFGATDAPKTTAAFNFSAGSDGVPMSFGANSGGFGSFGSSGGGFGGFGANAGVPNFGGGFNPPTAGTFSIGSGGPTKTRTQLKARRRT